MVRLITLDTHYFRSGGTADSSATRRYRQDSNPLKTILGAGQWEWLEKELRQPADVRILESSIRVVNDEYGWECWGGIFPSERRRLFESIAKTPANRVISVRGDRHFTELSRDRNTGIYPVYDFTASGLTQVANRGHLVSNGKRVGLAMIVQSFGGVIVDFTGPESSVVLQAFDDRGNAMSEHTVYLEDLQF